MLKSCLWCAIKHVGRANGYSVEAYLGYPHHAGLAVGELSLAEEELFEKFPDLAVFIRECREEFMQAITINSFYRIPVEAILAKLFHELWANDITNAILDADEPGVSKI